MKNLTKIFKWTAVTLGSLMLAGLLFYTVAYIQTERGIHKTYTVEARPLAIPTDSASYHLGQHLVQIRGCQGCHGADLSGGRAFADEQSPIGILYASNLTGGQGGIGYTDQDWIRALRHGIGKDGKSLWFMPSHETARLSNRDLAALICYIKKQPPVDRNIPVRSLKPLGRVLTFVGEFPLLTAQMIDHQAVYADDIAPAVDVNYGEYLAVTCTGCHSTHFKGGPAHAPNEPPIPDISSTGQAGKWTEAEFVSLFRSGKTPDGRLLNQAMPVKEFTYTDTELKALYLYLHRLK